LDEVLVLFTEVNSTKDLGINNYWCRWHHFDVDWLRNL